MTAAKLGLLGVTVEVRAENADFVRAVTSRFQDAGAPFEETLPERRDVRVAMTGAVARLDHQGQVGTIDVDACVVETPPSLVFADILVRAAVAWQLAARDGLLLHASAVRALGGAVVAFGVSGAGKSTVAGALGGALSDELVLIRRGAAGWEVAGTPWWRGARDVAPLPLARLVWLVRGEPRSTRPARGAELFRALVREAGRYFPDPAFQRRLFDLCADLAAFGAVRVAAAEGRVADDVREALAS